MRSDNSMPATRPALAPFYVFLASPDDVEKEREIVRSVVKKLGAERRFRDHLAIQLVAWDQPGGNVAMDATMTPQRAISQGLRLPANCDLVVVIFRARMGTPLPPEAYPDEPKSDGTPYRSGTEWEYWNAVRASAADGKPAVWVYHCTQTPAPALDDPDLEKIKEQWQSLQQFLKDFSHDDESIAGGLNPFDDKEGFRSAFEGHLRDQLERCLLAHESAHAGGGFDDELTDDEYQFGDHEVPVQILDHRQQIDKLRQLKQGPDGNGLIALVEACADDWPDFFAIHACLELHPGWPDKEPVNRPLELRLQRYDDLGLVQALQDALCEKTVGQLGNNDDASARERTVKDWLDAGEPRWLYVVIEMEAARRRLPAVIRGAQQLIDSLGELRQGSGLVILVACLREGKAAPLSWRLFKPWMLARLSCCRDLGSLRDVDKTDVDRWYREFPSYLRSMYRREALRSALLDFLETCEGKAASFQKIRQRLVEQGVLRGARISARVERAGTQE